MFFLALPAIALGLVATHQRYYATTRSGVTAAVANRKLWAGYTLPATATDVTYYADSYGCEADFAIAETDFVAWCAARGWAVTPISSPTPFFQPVLLPDDETPVADGFTFQMPNGEGTFDRTRSRAAFRVSTLP